MIYTIRAIFDSNWSTYITMKKRPICHSMHTLFILINIIGMISVHHLARILFMTNLKSEHLSIIVSFFKKICDVL